MWDGSFSTGNRRESFDKTAGVVERSLYVRQQGVSCLDTVAEEEVVDNKKRLFVS